jgi:polyisoprenyl-phosphate glycosyltransferase
MSHPPELRPPEVSLVLPARNEAAVLPQTLARLAQVMEGLGLDYEILVVDDGSEDDSFQRLQEAHRQDPRVRALRLSRRFGKEAALLAGLAHAGGAAVITLDADLQHPPELIPQMLDAWRQGAAIVHGVKRERGDRLGHRLGARLFNGAFSRLAGFDLHESSDFKLLDRRVVELLAGGFPERTRFFRGLSLWVGFRQTSLPFDVAPRPAGHSAWGGWGLVRYALDNLTAFTALPLQLVPLLGLLMLAVALVLGGEALYSRLSGRAVSGFATLEITLLFTGSLIMMGLGVVGQYLALIYQEIKRRPPYLIADRLGLEGQPADDGPPHGNPRRLG